VGGDEELVAITKQLLEGDEQASAFREEMLRLSEDVSRMQEVQQRRRDRAEQEGGTAAGLDLSTIGGGQAEAAGRRLEGVRARLEELEAVKLPRLRARRAELMDTAAAMDVFFEHVGEQSELESRSMAPWTGADYSGREELHRSAMRADEEDARFQARMQGGRAAKSRAEEQIQGRAADLRVHRRGMDGGAHPDDLSAVNLGRPTSAGGRKGADVPEEILRALSAGLSRVTKQPDRLAVTEAARQMAAMGTERPGTQRMHLWRLQLPSDEDGAVAVAAL